MPLCSVLSLVKTDLQTAHSTGNVGKEGLNSLGIPTTVIRKRKMPKKPKNKPMYRPIDPQIEQGNCIFFLNFQLYSYSTQGHVNYPLFPLSCKNKHLAETEVLTNRALEVYLFLL